MLLYIKEISSQNPDDGTFVGMKEEKAQEKTRFIQEIHLLRERLDCLEGAIRDPNPLREEPLLSDEDLLTIWDDLAETISLHGPSFPNHGRSAALKGKEKKGGGPTIQFAESEDLFQSPSLRPHPPEAQPFAEEKEEIGAEDHDAFLVVQEQEVKLATAAATKLTGCSHEAFFSRPFLEFIHPEDRKIILPALQNVHRRVEIPSDVHLRMIDGEGKTVPFMLKARPILWETRPATMISLATNARREAETMNPENSKAPHSAKQPVAKEESIETVAGKYLTFSLAGEDYGIRITHIKEIIAMAPITPVPRTPKSFKGVINLRGKIIPVIDLRTKFGLPEIPIGERNCIIILTIGPAERPTPMGILVDSVSEVMNIKGEHIEKNPYWGGSGTPEFILGMANMDGRVKILLDIERFLSREELALQG